MGSGAKREGEIEREIEFEEAQRRREKNMRSWFK